MNSCTNNLHDVPAISLSSLYFNIEHLKKNKLALENQTFLIDIFGSSIDHLIHDSNVELRSKLCELLSEVLKLKNINPKLQKLANSVAMLVSLTMNLPLEIGCRKSEIPLKTLNLRDLFVSPGLWPKIFIDSLDKNWTYFGIYNEVWAKEDKEEKPKRLGDHLSEITFIFKIAHSPFLITGSLQSLCLDSELKVWGTNSKTLIKEWRIPDLKSAHFINQSLIARTSNTLIELDFFPSGPDEEFSEVSKPPLPTFEEVFKDLLVFPS